MAKILSWFSTRSGRMLTRSIVGVSAFSSLAVQLAIHGPCQEKVKELCQLYQLGKPKPISDAVQKLIDKVLKDSNLKEEEKSKVKFFNVVGQDLCNFGGINSWYGAMIGIPFYFEDQRNINFAALRFRGYEDIDWVVEGQELMEALTLSEKAKKFGLMREIYSCNIWDKIDNAAILPFSILFPAEFARNVNKRADTFNRWSLQKRIKLYVVCFIAGFILFRLLKDPMKHISDKKFDEKAALVGSDYLEGGIEFYEHILMQNKALRNLLGKAGESKYDKNGNENYFLLAPKLPVSKRIEYLKNLQNQQVPKS